MLAGWCATVWVGRHVHAPVQVGERTKALRQAQAKLRAAAATAAETLPQPPEPRAQSPQPPPLPPTLPSTLGVAPHQPTTPAVHGARRALPPPLALPPLPQTATPAPAQLALLSQAVAAGRQPEPEPEPEPEFAPEPAPEPELELALLQPAEQRVAPPSPSDALVSAASWAAAPPRSPRPPSPTSAAPSAMPSAIPVPRPTPLRSQGGPCDILPPHVLPLRLLASRRGGLCAQPRARQTCLLKCSVYVAGRGPRTTAAATPEPDTVSRAARQPSPTHSDPDHTPSGPFRPIGLEAALEGAASQLLPPPEAAPSSSLEEGTGTVTSTDTVKRGRKGRAAGRKARAEAVEVGQRRNEQVRARAHSADTAACACACYRCVTSSLRLPCPVRHMCPSVCVCLGLAAGGG